MRIVLPILCVQSKTTNITVHLLVKVIIADRYPKILVNRYRTAVCQCHYAQNHDGVSHHWCQLVSLIFFLFFSSSFEIEVSKFSSSLFEFQFRSYFLILGFEFQSFQSDFRNIKMIKLDGFFRMIPQDIGLALSLKNIVLDYVSHNILQNSELDHILGYHTQSMMSHSVHSLDLVSTRRKKHSYWKCVVFKQEIKLFLKMYFYLSLAIYVPCVSVGSTELKRRTHTGRHFV